jgi:anaerobic ribonucleoside-triphosphate reductase activating protein
LCLTGGDPLFQKDAVRDLVGKSKFYNVLYTGHYYNDIPYDIISLFDMVVDGPYVKELRSGGFPASSNQKIYYR